MLNKRKIFNPQGDDSLKSVVNGNATNLLQLNNIKYKDIEAVDTVMDSNFWLPQKIDVTSDKYSFHNELQQEEREVFEVIISFLIFLDSIQTSNLSANLSGYFTAAEIVAALTTQAYFEKIHSKSYQYILQNIYDSYEKKNEVYEKYKEYPLLAERIGYIGKWYQDFQDDPNSESFIKALYANYILEGIYFYNSFIFFFNLGYKNKMMGTNKVIEKIKVDENLHVSLFEKIIKHYRREQNINDNYELLINMVKEAVEQEIYFMKTIIGNKILGISKETIEQYTKYLANTRLAVFNIDPIYENVENPYKHLESKKRSNFFETTVTSYNMSSAVSGWDDL